MERVCVVCQQNADIADTLQLRDVAMATTFWLQMGYNFGCMTASDPAFDSVGGFSVSSYLMKTTKIECLRDVAMATNLGLKLL